MRKLNTMNKKKSHHHSHLWGSSIPQSLKQHSGEILCRSDMLLQKQLDVALAIVSDLQGVAQKLEKSQSIEKTLLQQAIILDRMGQHMKFILEIANNINLELKYCRDKLRQCISDHVEESELIRQRIVWLEKKLEEMVATNSLEQLQQKFDIRSTLTDLKSAESYSSTAHRSLSPIKSFSLPKKSMTLTTIGQRENENNFDPEYLDEGDKYWLFGHHQFKYATDIDALLKDNPLSYHSIGLAVPASYVESNALQSENSNLPWIHEQDPMKGNFDIMRDDLERILKRISHIHSRIYDAANLSVNATDSNISSSTKLQNGDLPRIVFPDQRLKTPVMSASTVHETRSLKGFSGNFALQSHSATPLSKSVNSLPELSQLPAKVQVQNRALTKTNRAKTFPHSSDRWSNAEPNQDGVSKQPTIVNQRDLHDKTKLKLFVSKRTKKRSNVVRDLITPSSVTSNRSYRKVNTTVRFIENLKSSDGTALSMLQKERLKDLWSIVTSSPRADDRIYAARSLASLGVTSLDETIPVLTNALRQDEVSSARYEIAKALINLNEWDELTLKELTSHLHNDNPAVCLDILEQLYCSENARFMHLQLEEKPQLQELIEVLGSLAANQADDDEISFRAAVCLSQICGVYDATSASIATAKLLRVIKTTGNWEWHSQSLEQLVRQLNYFDEVILRAIIAQLKHAVKWKDRLSAALLIGYCGTAKVFKLMTESEAFDVFYPKLWDDAKREVRLGMSQAFTSLGLRNRLLEKLDENINNTNIEIRAQSVMVMSAAGIRSDKTLRSLIEMLGLDSSDYVRLHIMRTFHALGITDIRVVRALREREKGGGPLGKEASKILASLNIRLTTGVTSTVQSPTKSKSSRPLQTGDGRITTTSSWFSSPWRENNHTRESRRPEGSSRSCPSSDIYSTPHPYYEIISTAVRKSRLSGRSIRAATSDTHVTGTSDYL